jgi:hypothetical protein
MSEKEESPYKPEIDNSRSKQPSCPQLCPQHQFNTYKLKQGLRISYFSATLVLSYVLLSGLLLQLA